MVQAFYMIEGGTCAMTGYKKSVTIQRVLLSADRSQSEVRQASRDTRKRVGILTTLQVHPWKLSAPIHGRRKLSAPVLNAADGTGFEQNS